MWRSLMDELVRWRWDEQVCRRKHSGTYIRISVGITDTITSRGVIRFPQRHLCIGLSISLACHPVAQ